MEIPASHLRSVNCEECHASQWSGLVKRIHGLDCCKFMALLVFFGATFLCRSPHAGIIKLEWGVKASL